VSWDRALDDHRAAVAVLVDVLHAVPPALWREPRAPGHWSPAQIAEHLALTYEAVLRELAGEEPMRPKLSALRRTLLRWVLLPHILFHRSFPVRAPAPREVRPSESGADQEAVAGRLRDLAARFEHAITLARSRAGAGLTHPYFGRIPPLRALRFVTVHLEHHRRQVPVSELHAS
jgi:hypothetical protein